MAELKPCPFCGCLEIEIQRRIYPAADGYFGQCVSCETGGPLAKTYKSAIAAWNRREGE